jgi:hypothetical protein
MLVEGPCCTTSTHKRCSNCRNWLPHGFFGKDGAKVANVADLCLRCARKRDAASEARNLVETAMRRFGMTSDDVKRLTAAFQLLETSK